MLENVATKVRLVQNVMTFFEPSSRQVGYIMCAYIDKIDMYGSYLASLRESSGFFSLAY
jgi:hypothetical protein